MWGDVWNFRVNFQEVVGKFLTKSRLLRHQVTRFKVYTTVWLQDCFSYNLSKCPTHPPLPSPLFLQLPWSFPSSDFNCNLWQQNLDCLLFDQLSCQSVNWPSDRLITDRRDELSTSKCDQTNPRVTPWIPSSSQHWVLIACRYEQLTFSSPRRGGRSRDHPFTTLWFLPLGDTSITLAASIDKFKMVSPLR
jgi:hypothetical protein